MVRSLSSFRFKLKVIFTLTVVPFSFCESVLSEPPDVALSLKFFETNVRPVLEKNCYECHSASAKELQGGLSLDTREGVRRGGDSGPAVIPSESAKSLLLAAVRHEGLKMPPDRKLPESAIVDIQRWIQMGAHDPREGSATLSGAATDIHNARHYWSFRPIVAHHFPSVRNSNWPTSPIDFFILAKLEQSGLRPSPPADKLELCRRVYFDLHGLPPTPDQLQNFVENESSDAYAQLIDELLASPRYGERWGQHWLDVVRFAETEGFEYDRTIQGAWRYRDYVIRSFNHGKPIDEFLREQLAGDEFDTDKSEAMVASGFHRLGAVRRNAGNQEVAGSRNEVLTERTDIIGSAIMGLTIGCARCHNHKFDPISQKDYYRLQAFIAASQDIDVPLVSDEVKKDWNDRTSAIQLQIDELKSKLVDQTIDEQKHTRAKLDQLDKELPLPLPSISSIQNDLDKETPIHVLRRGEHDLPGERVTAGTPDVFKSAVFGNDVFGSSAEPFEIDRHKPRTALAKWLTHPTHPLTPRVFANRIWLNHFGRGIVATPNDFGLNGKQPSHPELLDFLAEHLVRSGWQAKSLHRLILLSSTYQQSSQPKSPKDGLAIDPENAMLWRFPLRRLSAEEIRDSMLVVSGQMNFAVGGTSIVLPVDKQLVAQLYKPSQWEITENNGERMRRSVYLLAKRNLRLPFMEVFDQPTLQTSCFVRQQSTHAPQALEMLNGEIANQMADAFADRLNREAGDVDSRVELAFELSAGRLPTDAERTLAKAFFNNGSTREFALALFNLNSFLYVR